MHVQYEYTRKLKKLVIPSTNKVINNLGQVNKENKPIFIGRIEYYLII